mmetsp:Transcript_24839/g.44964  ORF Transcript_24839/g.44964 Transcript_24839/m.44964 type:complete len:133 (+) Transcript_24839:1840-2238(+)
MCSPLPENFGTESVTQARQLRHHHADLQQVYVAVAAALQSDDREPWVVAWAYLVLVIAEPPRCVQWLDLTDRGRRGGRSWRTPGLQTSPCAEAFEVWELMHTLWAALQLWTTKRVMMLQFLCSDFPAAIEAL